MWFLIATGLILAAHGHLDCGYFDPKTDRFVIGFTPAAVA